MPSQQVLDAMKRRRVLVTCDVQVFRGGKSTTVRIDLAPVSFVDFCRDAWEHDRSIDEIEITRLDENYRPTTFRWGKGKG